MNNHVYDMLIIGAGPAGLGTAIYAVRAGFDVLVVDKSPVTGGQIINTTGVDNYLGLPGIGGFELGDVFGKHARELGVRIVTDEIINLEFDDAVKTVVGNNATYLARTVVLAMGAHHSKLGVAGEDEHIGRGVSYCATCDGAFFRKRRTIVVGGGDVAVGDAIYLSGLCEHVTLVHRRDELRAAKSLVDTLSSKDNITIMWNSVVEEITGDEMVTGAVIRDVHTGTVEQTDAAGVFIAVGMQPETELVSGKIDMDVKGYILAGEDCETSVQGVYAVGDIRTKQVRQVITAVADGAVAVYRAGEYLREIL